MTPDQFRALAVLSWANFMVLIFIFAMVCVIAGHIKNK